MTSYVSGCSRKTRQKREKQSILPKVPKVEPRIKIMKGVHKVVFRKASEF